MRGSKVRGGCRFFLKFGGVGFSNGQIKIVVKLVNFMIFKKHDLNDFILIMKEKTYLWF
jgi:hypothetical protein